MDLGYIRGLVKSKLIDVLAKDCGIYYAPVGVSNRHIHLSDDHLKVLFGKEHRLTPLRNLSQPDQFVCSEKLTVVGKRSRIEGVRVLGPTRSKTQVEVSVSDCFSLGIEPVVRMSGVLEKTPGITLIGPKGRLDIKEGVIVSKRHLHMSKQEAIDFGLSDGDKIRVRKSGMREMVLEDVIVRAGDGHKLELHLDTDEANAGCIKTGDLLNIENLNKEGNFSKDENRNIDANFINLTDGKFEDCIDAKKVQEEIENTLTIRGKKQGEGCEKKNSKNRLFLETDIDDLYRAGTRNITRDKDTILTPLAIDRARQLGIEILYKKSGE